jgi:two-component SAPR family response regulator
MNMSDIKLYAINGISLAMSFAHIDTVLKIILLSASIGYTLQRWYLLEKERRENNNGKNKE